MDWIKVGEDEVQWWAYVNSVMNLLVPEMRGVS
jgi:hypothetical protein